MRKFGIKYAASHPQYLELREAYGKVRHFADWQNLLDLYYAEDLPGHYPDRTAHVVYGGCEPG